MDRLEAEFVKGATGPEGYPQEGEPETAFIGRSNVGKSSLLNNLLLRKNLARISATPGKTREINFFRVAGLGLFVDLPGFGYAKVSKREREQWGARNRNYLLARAELKLVCYLVDSRHDPGDIDLGYIEWLELNARPYLIVLTKTDKIGEEQVRERQEQMNDLLQQCRYARGVIAHSSKTSTGRSQILAVIKRESTG